MPIFEGRWKYQSYRPEPISIVANDPAVTQTFIPWSPPGVVTIDEGGVTGKLVLKGVPFPLNLTFQITEGTPTRLSISAVAPPGILPDGMEFTNELQGWFVPATLEHGPPGEETPPIAVRGTIVQTSEDIAKVNPQPRFTSGFFVLEPE